MKSYLRNRIYLESSYLDWVSQPSNIVLFQMVFNLFPGASYQWLLNTTIEANLGFQGKAETVTKASELDTF